MSKTRPPYPPEFRREAIRLLRSGGRSPRQLAGELGCSEQTLRNWLRQDEADRGERSDVLSRLLLDEADTIMTPSGSFHGALQTVCNSGYKANGKVTIARGGKAVSFSTFCPKAFAGIGRLPDTISDRAISVTLQEARLRARPTMGRTRPRLAGRAARWEVPGSPRPGSHPGEAAPARLAERPRA